MAFSIELYFNTEFETKIRDLWALLQDYTLPSIMQKIGSRPHLALSVLDYIEQDEIPDILGYLSANCNPFDIEFPAISMIPGQGRAVVLSPSSNNRLIEIQHLLYAYLTKKGCSSRQFYEPGRWFPHCTLSKELSFKETLETLRVCETHTVTGTARVTQAGVISFRPRKELGSCRLNAGDPKGDPNG